ncbi:septum formation initiator family protein [Rhizosaccharibacter radicis]|uniref:Septum formation initiator family protein n=1 Tax=Rhizosaccharibacter radicis TaxID=2782605 RepID=A0ABT1VV48_9PROT|nr:septum formation initiator family protein [Acetobacteraceae bacterium KSS12]
MSVGRMIKRKVREAIPPLLFLSLVGYFGWNATQGDHGLRTYQAQLHLLDQAKAAQAAANAEQVAWTQKVGGLRASALDADSLDERARAMLNLTENGDLVVPYGNNHKLY